MAGPSAPASQWLYEIYAHQVVLQASANMLQWKYDTEATSAWKDLYDLSQLIGPAGPAGQNIDLQTSATHIQWKPSGSAIWNDLVPLSSLVGPAGAQGDPGDPGVIQSLVAGENVTIDATDPANPIISTAGGSSLTVLKEAALSRFIVAKTVNTPADAGTSTSINAVRTTGAGTGNLRALGVTPTGMTSATVLSAYIELEIATLPGAGNSAVPIYWENVSSYESVIVLTIEADGSIGIATDQWWSFFAVSAPGVVTAGGAMNKILVTQDKTALGGVITVYVNGTSVISAVCDGEVSVETSYRIYVENLSTSGMDVKHSNFAVWDAILSAGDITTLFGGASPDTVGGTSLKAYWKLDEGTGTTCAATTGGVTLNFNGTDISWDTISSSTPPTDGTVVRIGTAASGDFTGHDNQIAALEAGVWDYLTLKVGHQCYDQGAATETLWNGSAWV